MQSHRLIRQRRGESAQESRRASDGPMRRGRACARASSGAHCSASQYLSLALAAGGLVCAECTVHSMHG
jgi:hypothetical protein